MCLWNTNAPGHNKDQIDYFKYKGQGQKVIDSGVIWKGFIRPNKKICLFPVALWFEIGSVGRLSIFS